MLIALDVPDPQRECEAVTHAGQDLVLDLLGPARRGQGAAEPRTRRRGRTTERAATSLHCRTPWPTRRLRGATWRKGDGRGVPLSRAVCDRRPPRTRTLRTRPSRQAPRPARALGRGGDAANGALAGSSCPDLVLLSPSVSSRPAPPKPLGREEPCAWREWACHWSPTVCLFRRAWMSARIEISVANLAALWYEPAHGALPSFSLQENERESGVLVHSSNFLSFS